MRKRKGFTLIELLAVIVILAIIMVIAVPKILKVIENSERKAFSESAGLMAKAAELKYSESSLTSPIGNETYIYENGELTSGSPTLTFKGDKPFSGKIVQERGRVTLAVVSKNKKWCAIKNEGERLAKVYKIGTEIEIEDCVIGYIEEEPYICVKTSEYQGEDLTSTGTPDDDGYYISSDYKFSIDESRTHASIVGYTGAVGDSVDIIIPMKIDDVPITTISGGTFSSRQYRNVIISPNIVTIEQGAFSGSKVSKINFDYAKNLENLSLYGLESTGDIILACNSKLTTISNSQSLVTPKLEAKNLENLTTVSNFQNSKINNLVLKDDEKLTTLSSFEGSTIGNMTLDNIAIETLNMQYTNSSSFENLTLRKLKKLTTIAESSFKGTKLNELVLNNNNTPNLKSIGRYAFQDTYIDTLKIENIETLESIGDSAFKNSKGVPDSNINVMSTKSINSLTLNNLINLTTIGDSAFYDQNISLFTINGLNGLTTISQKAFYRNNIEKISFDGMPNVKTIGYNAFHGNPLKELDFKKATKLSSLGGSSFWSTTNIDKISFAGLNNTITGNLVDTGGTVNLLDFSNTGENMTTFINTQISNFTTINSINLSGSKITKLNLQSRSIENLNLKGCSSIIELTGSSNNISKLDLSSLTSLKTINLIQNNIKVLRIPANVESVFVVDDLECLQIDGDNSIFTSSNFPMTSSDALKSTCSFD